MGLQSTINGCSTTGSHPVLPHYIQAAAAVVGKKKKRTVMVKVRGKFLVWRHGSGCNILGSSPQENVRTVLVFRHADCSSTRMDLFSVLCWLEAS
jgi:hypothetical protein